MLTRHALLCSIAIASLTSAAGAQSPGIVFDQQLVMQRPTGKTDTILTRSVESTERYRTEYVRSSAAIPFMRTGMTQLVTAGDSDLTIVFVDSARKMYAEMKTSAMLSGMGAMGATMKFDSTGDSTRLDSIGPGPMVAGHATIHFQMHSGSRMSMAVFGDTSVRTMAITTDFYVAPDLMLDSSGRDSTRAKAAVDRLRAMTRGLPGVDALAAKASKAAKRLAKYGTPLKTVTETTITGPAGSVTRHSSMETLTYERKIVPDSLFVIPMGYKKVPLMDFVSQF
ncbi:MAG: hypothetical protein ACRENK_05120 [Gemmatimonadaceae bacterium]